jgi:predicted membrane-bound dolichyl-phosphate-mannose-protein mannosyltransferase
MKVSREGLEGTPQEIRDFFQDNGLQAKNYLTQVEQPLGKLHFVTSSIVYAASAVLLVFIPAVWRAPTIIAFVLGVISLGWLSISLQLRYKNVWAATLCVIMGIPLLLVAVGLIAPLDFLNHLQQIQR